MNITTTAYGEVKVVALNGNFNTNTSPDAEAHFDALINEGTTKIIVDLHDLHYISSAGLQVLLVTTKLINSKGGQCRICNLNELVQEVFDVSGLSMIFGVFLSVDDALKGF
jgi:anti-sigma B factor antagonist